MGFINKYITKKCIFCGSKEDLKYIPDYGIYGGIEDNGDHYHDECIIQICADPEGAGHGLVDRAIDIMQRVKDYKKDKEDEQKRRENSLKSLCI